MSEFEGKTVDGAICGEALASFFQVSEVKQCIDVAVASCLAYVFAEIVEDGSHSGGVVAVFVGTCAVAAHGIDLIFYRACAQEQFVGFDTRYRPVGGDKEQVVEIVGSVARPHREAQVVADDDSDVPSAVTDDGWQFGCRSVGGVFR